MVDQRLREALIDVQTIIIVGLLYVLLREEQSNAYFRIWLSDNFPLGLYILAPLTVAAISATLLLITTVRVLIFVTNRDLVPETEKTINRLGKTARRSRLLVSVRRARQSVIILSGAGLALSVYSYLVISVVPITALGILCIILGLTIESLSSDTDGSGTKVVLHEEKREGERTVAIFQELD
ncbi:MAG TPA: hypothetical protein VFE96_03175 [Candidatus Bathyarchaeia archaeon]|nr:hypothetical protein [Candidatus Bathyarchaeia archaeon]